MKFEYQKFVPRVGNLVVDGYDGSHGIVVGVGTWHTFAYFVEQGAIKVLTLQVMLPEYNNLVEQYTLKCIEKDNSELVMSPLRFIDNDDADLIKVNL